MGNFVKSLDLDKCVLPLLAQMPKWQRDHINVTANFETVQTITLNYFCPTVSDHDIDKTRSFILAKKSSGDEISIIH